MSSQENSAPESQVQEQVTILVHGSFANPDYESDKGETRGESPEDKWWRLTDGDQRSGTRSSPRWQRRSDDPRSPWRRIYDTPVGTTADRLTEQLKRIDESLAETVWYPGGDARDGDLTYRELCEWSGKNTHQARVQGAKKLARSLGKMADRRGCSPGSPLLVNYVAHSHGGNVVLESLKYLGDNVKPRQVIMMGTPLVWKFHDMRILYLVFPLLFFREFLLWSWGWVEEFSTNLAGAEYSLTLPGLLSVIIALALYAVSLPLVLWAGVLAYKWALSFWDSAATWLGIVGLQSLADRGSQGQPAYGPPPRALERQLDGRPAVLFISAKDEADLMLQLGAAPIDAYRAMIEGRPDLAGAEGFWDGVKRLVLKIVELCYLRPFSIFVAAPALEDFLEWRALGFGFWDVLLAHNYEMVTWGQWPRTYEPSQIMRREVREEDLKKRVVRVPVSEGHVAPATGAGRRPGTVYDRDRTEDLRQTLEETLKGLEDQVHLRHSGYYESPHVIAAVASVLAGDEALPASTNGLRLRRSTDQVPA